MTPIKQSACWGCLMKGDVKPEEGIKAAAEIGFASIEMGPQEYFGAIKDAGMDIAIFVGHKSLADGLNKRENHERIYDELMASLETAVEYNVPSLLCLSGNRYDGVSDLQGAEICAEILSRVAPAAEEKGITLCTELLNSKVNHPGYMCDSTEWGVHLCKMVNSPRVKLLYDIYHMQIMEGDLIRTIRDNIQWFGHFHTAGNPGRNDMDETQEIYYPAVARCIAELDYQGYVGHEFLTHRETGIIGMREAFATWNVV
ncbi:MAG: TIM barrel protein [Armatimonadetes bacterium]|nr:TIM barrel protein [Armatimonadota bacterium]MDI9585006.1 TIM barrel protein [Acidobacteriota bacterium]